MELHRIAYRVTRVLRKTPRSVAQDDSTLAANSNPRQTKKKWKEFADGDTSAWNKAFTDAWNRFTVIGNDVDSLQDCSSIIPSGASERRLAKRLGGSAAARAFVRRLYDS